MEYIKIVLFTIIFYIKKCFKKGNWNIKFYQSFHPSVKFVTKKNSNINLRKKIIFERYSNIYVGNEADLYIGESTYFNQGAIISCQKSIRIGSHCLFGPNVKIYDNNHKFKKNVGVSFEHSAKEIEVGNHCWIASNVVILKGSKIGNNCVIGANCVVSGIIPDNSIVKCNNEITIQEIKQ